MQQDKLSYDKEAADAIIVTERMLQMFGICKDFIGEVKSKGTKEISVHEIISHLEQKNHETYNEVWNKIITDRKHCDFIQDRLYNDFFTVDKFYVKNPFTLSYDEFDTLDEAKQKQEQNKIDFVKDLDESIIGDLNDYLEKIKEHFVIEEQITTYFGHTIRTVVG